MASLLNAISLAVQLLGNDPNARDDRREWRDYAWVEPAYGSCISTDAAGMCHAAHQKWDWKRNQWVDFSYRLLSAGTLSAELTLTNNDTADADDVCVTALFVDGAGHARLAFHENVHVRPTEVQRIDRSFEVPPGFGTTVKTVVIGSKQCREGPTEDAALYEKVKAGIGQL